MNEHAHKCAANPETKVSPGYVLLFPLVFPFGTNPIHPLPTNAYPELPFEPRFPEIRKSGRIVPLGKDRK